MLEMDRDNLTRAQWFEEVILLTETLNDEIRDASRDIADVCSESETKALTAKIYISGVTFSFLGYEVGYFPEIDRLNPGRIAYRIRRSITRYARIVSDLDRFAERNKVDSPKVQYVDEIAPGPDVHRCEFGCGFTY